MIQSKNYPHSPRQVLSFSENHKKHTLTLRTQGQGKKAQFEAKLNRAELKKVVEFIENEFPIHKEDVE